METQADVVIVGGGIAGLSALARLAERGVRAVLVEREPWLAGHASGRNAAIWRPLEDDDSTATLAAESDAWLQLNLSAAPIERVGLLLAAGSEEQLAGLTERARRDAVPHDVLHGAALLERSPEAQAIMERLPLAKESLMDHEYIAVGPLFPLRLLMANPVAKQTFNT